MPELPRWLSGVVSDKFHIIKHQSTPPKVPTNPTDVETSNPAHRCSCHPALEHKAGSICKACQKFISECHWIKLYKLPSSKFSKLSKRQIERGSYVADGDAGGTLYWNYEYPYRKLTRDCPLCALFETAWDVSPEDTGDLGSNRIVQMEISVQFRGEKDKDEARLDLRFRVAPMEDKYVSLRIYHEWKEKNPELDKSNQRTAVAKSDQASTMGKCTASEANFDLARSWLRKCISEHSRCAEPKSDESRHPLRLIAVGSDDQNPHLYEIEPNLPIPEYLTLSHCWGGKVPLRLTAISFEEYKKEIPLQALSKTFRDAILTVRKLGYQYIWIDSLCIIQDSIEDWQKESQHMGDIYRNSVCTIAATASEDGAGGLFRLRNPLRQQRCEVWSDDTHGIYVEIEADKPLEHYRSEVNGGILNTRAWVLQERYLSPRLIHYTTSAVYWDCRERHLTDSGKATEDEQTLSLGFGEGSARPFQFQEIDFSEDFPERWQFAVEKYSSMKLTKESDRLIAFQGVTKYFEGRTGLKSVNGLWREYLPSQLLWRVSEASCRSGPTNNGLPTWSWASVETRINFFPPHVDDLALTFWYPTSDGGWPEQEVVDLNDPNLVDDIVSQMTRQLNDRVDPLNGYSASKVVCATYLVSESTDSSISIYGKISTARTSATMVLEDNFTVEQVTMILETLHIDSRSTSEDYCLLVCQWPDRMIDLPDDITYLLVHAEGAHYPKMDRFVSEVEEDGILAPYALHTSGLMLAPTDSSNIYTRVGYFRAIETFSKAPSPHPKGVKIDDEALLRSWFGERCKSENAIII